MVPCGRSREGCEEMGIQDGVGKGDSKCRCRGVGVKDGVQLDATGVDGGGWN